MKDQTEKHINLDELRKNNPWKGRHVKTNELVTMNDDRWNHSNFSVISINASKNVSQAQTFASPEVKITRRQICAACEFLILEKICSKCGCLVSVKTMLEATNCPIDKW